MDEAVTQFLQFLTVEKGASQNTVAAYRNDIQQFAAFGFPLLPLGFRKHQPRHRRQHPR